MAEPFGPALSQTTDPNNGSEKTVLHRNLRGRLRVRNFIFAFVYVFLPLAPVVPRPSGDYPIAIQAMDTRRQRRAPPANSDARE